MIKYWKVFCDEGRYPGLWPHWFKNQCAAIGWPPKRGYTQHGETDERGWSIARSRFKSVEKGDFVLVQLKGNCVGRIGEVVRKKGGDNQWDPTVPPSKEHPFGQMGRRIEVRWDLNVGPIDADTVISLPASKRLPTYAVRPTISELESKTFNSVVKAMKDEANWVGLQGRFEYERSISDYVATYPHRLEDDLMPYPNAKIREKAFSDKTRSDVLLIHRDETPVVVECKQGAPTLENIQQLRGYMKHVKKITGKKPRGILVHGGAASLRHDVRSEVADDPLLRIVRYSLLVDFVPCT